MRDSQYSDVENVRRPLLLLPILVTSEASGYGATERSLHQESAFEFFTREIRRALRRRVSNLDRLGVRNEPVDMRLTDSASQTYLRPMSGKGQPLRVLGKQDAYN